MENINDMKISGSGSITSGVYNDIKISGSGSILGDVTCNDVKISGSASSKGSIKANSLKVSGSSDFAKDVEVNEFLQISGSAKFEGNIKGGNINISGSCKVNGNISGESIAVSGSISVGGNCEGTEVIVGGGANIKGLLSADRIKVNSPSGYIKEIGGSDIRITNTYNSILFGFIKFNGKRELVSELIEGDFIELENVRCDLVRGHDVKIGENCIIKMVEYTGTLEIDKKSKVDNFVSVK